MVGTHDSSAGLFGRSVHQAVRFLIHGPSIVRSAAGRGQRALLYGLHRRAGLPAGLAVIGALTITLSPVFIPNAATFMTDIPALFLFLVSLYGYVLVADVLDAGEAAAELPAFWPAHLWGWLLLGLTAGLLGGTVRQIDWFVPILVPGFLLVRHGTFRRLRPAIVPLTVSAAVALGGAVAFSAWFQDQPYAIPEKAFEGVTLLFTKAKGPAMLCRMLVFLVQTVGIMMLPLLIAVPLLYRRWFGGPLDAWLRLTNAILLALFIWFVASLGYGGGLVFSWCGNTIVAYPYMTTSARRRPVVFATRFHRMS